MLVTFITQSCMRSITVKTTVQKQTGLNSWTKTKYLTLETQRDSVGLYCIAVLREDIMEMVVRL